jgi:hypothetical protein
MVLEGKLVVRATLLLLFLSTTVKADNIEVFYNGFWSHSPFPNTIERLQKTYSLHFLIDKSSVPEKYLAFLEEGFQAIDENSLAVDYVFYLTETNEAGEIVKKLAGGNNILFNLTNKTFKHLSEIEKKQLNNYIKDISCEKSDFLPYKKI